jgi:hypothetical protein
VKDMIFKQVNKKNGVLWDVTPYGSRDNGRFGGTYHFHYHDKKSPELRTMLTVLVTANVVSS